MKYTTLAELLDAVKNDELDLKDCRPLRLDNDSATLDIRGEEEDGEEDVRIFHIHPAQLMEQALDLLGIPWEEV